MIFLFLLSNVILSPAPECLLSSVRQFSMYLISTGTLRHDTPRFPPSSVFHPQAIITPCLSPHPPLLLLCCTSPSWSATCHPLLLSMTPPSWRILMSVMLSLLPPSDSTPPHLPASFTVAPAPMHRQQWISRLLCDCSAAEPRLVCVQMPGRVAGWNPSTRLTTASSSWPPASSMETQRKTKVSPRGVNCALPLRWDSECFSCVTCCGISSAKLLEA